MLFGVTYEPRPGGDEDRQERALQVFTEWSPPEGLDIRAMYFRADGNGGLAIVEAESAAPIAEAVAPFSPFFEYEVVPLMEPQEAIPVLKRAMEWRESVR
jgi:Protein of unknown function (DUF3303)